MRSSIGHELGAVLILSVGCFLLGAWRRRDALFAFTLFVPLLVGLDQTRLMDCASATTLCFSALWIGIQASLFGAQFGFPGLQRPIVSHRDSFREAKPLLLSVHILIAAVVISLCWQLLRHERDDSFWLLLTTRPVFGYGDPWYFLTASFVWLLGLNYFLELGSEFGSEEVASDGTNSNRTSISSWVAPVVGTYCGTIVIFFLFQFFVHIPEGWAGAGFQSPFEDISSFGSICVLLLMYVLAVLVERRTPTFWTVITAIFLICMVVASWSRGAWLAAVIFGGVLALFHFGPRGRTVILGTAIAIVALVNLSLRLPVWENQPYLSRLASLVRIENPENKDSGRIPIYRKAVRMIAERPLVGFGIGSFYRTSTSYADKDDIYGAKPDFAHNVYLEIAAEEGLPIAAVFAFLTMYLLKRGIVLSRRGGTPHSNGNATYASALGLTLSVGAYLQTQLTANSLNVYPSNQFLFWFLAAVIAFWR